MPTSPVRTLIEHICRAVLPEGDGELLGRFVERRDERALAALVDRHGPMVWGVCRRLLSHHDAEDAFQAAFIVLVRKAASVKPREMVGNWLYGVARQAALQARTAARRREIPAQIPDTEAPQDQWAEVRPILDEELSRLPNHYRAVIVLCDLEGRTRRDVAVHLGCPEGTVASRLARARAMLAKRLTRRGVALSGGALAVVLSQNAASAGMPAALASSTIKAASLCGQAAVKVAALAEGVLKAMLVSKLKTVAVVLVVGFLAVGAIGFGVARGQTKGDAPQKQAGEKAQKVEDAVVKEQADEEEAVAWGKEIDGLQAGLTTDAHSIRQGETIKFTVKLRNVGKADVKFTHGLLKEYAPEVTADGVHMSVYMPTPKEYKVRVTERVLKPGETITLYNPEVVAEPEALTRLQGLIRVDKPTIFVEPGRYKFAFGGMIQSHPKLTTGTVEFEVKDQVAWGKEVKGLQMGLVLADARSYKPGEKVTLEVKARNVSKAPVTITYGLLNESAPQITYPEGGEVNVQMPPIALFIVIPTEEVIGPGKTVTLYRPEFAVEAQKLGPLPGPVPLVSTPTIQVAAGKYKVAYSGMLDSHPTLSTGTVEVEVKDQVAWGKEVGGLQAGVSISNPSDIQIGGKAAPDVSLRNVSNKTITASVRPLWDSGTRVVDAVGKRVRSTSPAAPLFEIVPEKITLKPGETVVVAKTNIFVVDAEAKDQPFPEGVVDQFTIHVRPGTYKVDFPGFVQEHPTLATGTAEFEVQEPTKPASKSAYPTADVVVQYRDETGREVRDLQQFHVKDAETVAELASHFPGILGDRGSGPRTTAGKPATFTIKFFHKSGEASQVRVAHVTADYATWFWRDNTPYTGDRQVEGKDQLRNLLERLAEKNKVDLK